MIKTQIQLEEWQYRSLKAASAASGRSLSDLVRGSVSEYLQSHRRKPSVPLAELAGRYTARPVDDLSDHDRGWVEAIR